MELSMRPQPNSGPSDPTVHQQDTPITALLDLVFLCSLLSKSRPKGSSRHRQSESRRKHANKKWEKSPSKLSKKRIASPTASKSGETLHLDMGASGVPMEHGPVPLALRAEDTQRLQPMQEAGLTLSSVKERRE